MAADVPRAAKVCELAADIVANAGRYQAELANIAVASPGKWGLDAEDFQREFRFWAQSRARHALNPVGEIGQAADE